jgi:hypothetical protein
MEEPKSLEKFNKRLKSEVDDLLEETFGLLYSLGFSDKKPLNNVTSSNLIAIWKRLAAYKAHSTVKCDKQIKN